MPHVCVVCTLHTASSFLVCTSVSPKIEVFPSYSPNGSLSLLTYTFASTCTWICLLLSNRHFIAIDSPVPEHLLPVPYIGISLL